MEYPKREKFFAHRFCRLMAKVCLANEIGPEACWMLSVIVHTEDASHYRRPVTFFNEQLFSLVGLGSLSSLRRARERAVEAGWLHYEHGTKRRAASYWVTIPAHAENLDDMPTDEQPDEYSCSESNQNPAGKRQESGENPAGKRQESGENPAGKRRTIYPIPNPIPGGEGPPTPIQKLEEEFLRIYTGPKLDPNEVYSLVEEALVAGVTEQAILDEIGRIARPKRELPRLMIDRLIAKKNNHTETPEQRRARIAEERRRDAEERQILKLERNAAQ